MIVENGIYKWKYKASKEKEDAYEQFMATYPFYTAEQYSGLSSQEKDKYLNQVIQDIRKINVFPIYYFNEEGILNEIKSTFEKNDVCFVNDALYTKANQGLLVLDFLFPNLHLAESFSITGNNCYSRFFDDDKLKRCLDKALTSETRNHNMRTFYFKESRFYYSTPINFAPIRAKAIYERFCPPNGIIYDYSAGYGGRMLGALSSSRNFYYIATDPNKNTYYNLLNLGKYIEKVSKRENSYKIYNLPSEKLGLKPNSIDFAFSCPPFFKREIYSNEETQSTVAFPVYEDWLEGYVRPTIQNCYIALKDNGIYGVDIMNYFYSGKKVTLVQDWIKIAEEEGFVFRKAFPIQSQVRAKKDENEIEKIYIFTKNDKQPLPDYTSASVVQNYSIYLDNLAAAKERKSNLIIGEYDVLGNLINTYNSYSEINKPASVIRSLKLTEDLKYYRVYTNNEIVPTEIEISKLPICKIDDEYFFSMAAAGRYLGVSRQAVQQSKNRHSTQINGKTVEWIGDKE